MTYAAELAKEVAYRMEGKKDAKPEYKGKNWEARVRIFHESYTIDPETKCWNWNNPNHAAGYGAFHIGGEVSSHRASFVIHFGGITEGLLICHSCDNPRCVNPLHLFQGSQLENMRDMIRKGRKIYVVGEANPVAKLTNEQAREIFLATGPQWTIAEKYGISRRGVGKIKQGLIWKHVTEDLRNDH